MAKLNKISKLTENKFLNLYSLQYTNEKTNKDFNYFVASRRKEEDLACSTKDHKRADAVLMATINAGGIYLIKQFRPAINDYVLEFPAGLVDEGEHFKTAIIREVKEEIGLECETILPLTPPCYTSVGMSDETVASYIVHVKGTPSTKGNEENEDIEILYFKQNEIPEILSGEHGIVSIKTMLILHLLNAIQAS